MVICIPFLRVIRSSPLLQEVSLVTAASLASTTDPSVPGGIGAVEPGGISLGASEKDPFFLFPLCLRCSASFSVVSRKHLG